MSWRDHMDATERRVVEKAENAKRKENEKASAKADAVINPIRERCFKRMQRASKKARNTDNNTDKADE